MGPYPPPHGGVQTNLVAIRRFLLARDIPCSVINLTRYRQAETDGIYYPESASEVLKLLRSLPCDIIHMHIGGNVSTRLLGLGFISSLMPRRKTVLTLHSGGYPRSEPGRKASPRSWRGFAFRRFDKIISVNEEMVEMFRRFGVPDEKIHLICPHALMTRWQDVTLPERLQRFFASHRPALLTVSGLRVEYDVPLQIEALGAVRERFPEAGLVIIGAGEREEEIKSLIASKPYAEHILLCGDVPHEQTLRAISESDLFLRTTHFDGDSISVREALHMGVPVIATDNGMRPAGVHLVPKSNAPALVEAISTKLEGGSRGPSKNGSPDEENVAAVYKLYEELMRGPQGRI